MGKLFFVTEEIHVHVHIHDDPRLAEVVSILRGQVVPALTAISRQIGQEMAAIDTLSAEVTETLGVEESAIVLLNGLKAALDAAIASGNPAQLQALSDTLGAERQSLAASVAANQPAPPPPGS